LQLVFRQRFAEPLGEGCADTLGGPCAIEVRQQKMFLLAQLE
jgi:hypothetical protein